VAKNQEVATHLMVLGERRLPEALTAVFCSVKCPGKLILDTYDLCQNLRLAGVAVISGFHSPMERECLQILLRSENQVVWCLARGLLKRVPAELRDAVDQGRLLICTPFPASVRRVTAETAMQRNRAVAQLARRVVVSHASPGSKMEKLSRDILSADKPLYTFDHPANKTLLDLGARTVESMRL
jgi:predicted Rossmann fold nucleotide-binding protein DprA/Smf involved in DNA uptake